MERPERVLGRRADDRVGYRRENTAVFSMLNGFERPLPTKSPEQIVVIAADAKEDETGLREDVPETRSGGGGLPSTRGHFVRLQVHRLEALGFPDVT